MPNKKTPPAMKCSYCHASDHWMKHKDKKTGKVCILCPKLIEKNERKAKKEKKEQERKEIEARKATIALIIEEEEKKNQPVIISGKFDYWNNTRFNPLIRPMHCPFSAIH